MGDYHFMRATIKNSPSNRANNFNSDLVWNSSKLNLEFRFFIQKLTKRDIIEKSKKKVISV